MGKALSLISKLHESGSRFIVESLKANGIMDFSPSHGDILAALYTKNRITMKEISSQIHRTKATVSVLVDKLEKTGFVKREKAVEDNRVTYILLTKKGENFREVFNQISKDLNDMLYKNLSDTEALALDLLLEKMIKR